LERAVLPHLAAQVLVVVAVAVTVVVAAVALEDLEGPANYQVLEASLFFSQLAAKAAAVAHLQTPFLSCLGFKSMMSEGFSLPF
jgi:hypothetical protein